MTSEEYAQLFDGPLHRHNGVSRAWDLLEVHLHHDYLEVKGKLARDNLSPEQHAKFWRDLKRIITMTRGAALARANGEDAVAWRLAYLDSND